MVAVGAVLGLVILIVDNVLERRKTSFRAHLMPTAVGMYLPVGLSVPILLGGILAHVVGRGARNPEEIDRKMHHGVLFSSGIIAGESLMGVFIAILAAAQVTALEPDVPFATGITAIAAIGVLVLFALRTRPPAEDGD